MLRARFVVNAAGASAGAVSALAGGEPYAVWPRKGQYVLLDREFGRRMRSIVFATPLADTKGVNVVPTTHGTCLLGPTADDHDDARDAATDADTLAAVRASAARLVPASAGAAPIKVFAANRPASDERLRLRLDSRVDWLLHATNRSTGVSIAPAAAERALALLREAGLDAPDRDGAVLRAARRPAPAHRARPRAAHGARPRLRAGRLRVRAGQRRRARRRAARPGRRALGRRGAQAHGRDLRPLPGRDVPGRR